jgi:hemerythrin-like metal-binding protein
MPLFIWKPSYEVGVPEIDHDHRILVGMINELYEAMKEGRGYELINQTMDRLIDYVARHFETEESFMRVGGYPKQDEHAQEHRRFSDMLREMDLRRREGHSPTTIELMTFLCDWLRDHVTNVDKELGTFIKRTP